MHGLTRLVLCAIGWCAVCMSWWAPPGFTQADQGAYAPIMNANSTTFRIGYLEGGPYAPYATALKATVAKLAEFGWCEPVTFPEFDDPEDTRAVWDYLASSLRSDFLTFPADAFYSANWEGRDQRNAVQQALLGRLAGRQDLDLILAMGTHAGQDLANTAHATPTMVMQALDPLDAGIVRSVEDSGINHLHARVDPAQWQRQIQVFHDAVGFKVLGVAYENTTEGRTLAALDDVRLIARQRGFEVRTCETRLRGGAAEAAQNLTACHAELAEEVDAVYVTDNNGTLPAFFPQVLAPLFDKHIPTFAMRGEGHVRLGAMLGISNGVIPYEAMFYARTIAQILRGAAPRTISQRFDPPITLALNLEAAAKVGYDPSVEVLLRADKVFEVIADPDAPLPSDPSPASPDAAAQ